MFSFSCFILEKGIILCIFCNNTLVIQGSVGFVHVDVFSCASVLFRCCIVFHCVIISSTHSTPDGHLGCFWFFATTNMTAMDTLAHISLCWCARGSLRVMFRCGSDEFSDLQPH